MHLSWLLLHPLVSDGLMALMIYAAWLNGYDYDMDEMRRIYTGLLISNILFISDHSVSSDIKCNLKRQEKYSPYGDIRRNKFANLTRKFRALIVLLYIFISVIFFFLASNFFFFKNSSTP